MAKVDISRRAEQQQGRFFSWINDLLQKIKDLLTLPDRPELVPVPVRRPGRRPVPKDR